LAASSYPDTSGSAGAIALSGREGTHKTDNVFVLKPGNFQK
jgi:hypothetical protein